MVGCNAPMLETVVISVGLVPQSWCVLLSHRIARGDSVAVVWLLLLQLPDAADLLQC